jgi:hypothetical protein
MREEIRNNALELPQRRQAQTETIEDTSYLAGYGESTTMLSISASDVT